MYLYKMIQTTGAIQVKNSQSGTEAAEYLEDIANSMAKDGWEFYRSDRVSVAVKPGCIDSFLGKKTAYYNYDVLTFRREA